jgi:UDP-N-acetylmuramate dehydrogenase
MLEKRNMAQPTSWPSGGSVFRNPPGDHAGRLIEQCGLKGKTIGDARISEKHANFIVHEGAATAADIESLITQVAEIVEKEHGVRLKPEVCIIGKTP